jgi:hypothetical protein
VVVPSLAAAYCQDTYDTSSLYANVVDIDLVLVVDTDMDQAQYVAVLQRELATCDELLSIEPECKQALLSVALLLQQLIQLEAGNHDNQDSKTRVSEIFEKLRVIDPIRANYYHDIQAKV